jgi:hypothetical protein
MDTTDASNWRLRDLIHHVCGRPRMIAYNGSFHECAAFLDGFVQGRSGEMERELGTFRRWLADRAYAGKRMARNYVWQVYILDLFPQEERIFIELPALFDQFLSESRIGE